MFKLITVLVAVIPIVLFLRTIFIGKSKVVTQATSEFRKQIDYLVWGILFLVGCALSYAVGKLIYFA